MKPPSIVSLAGPASSGSLPIDPVCGMSVDPAHAAAELTHKGAHYFFCCRACSEKFVADPVKYLRGAKAEAPQSINRAAEYVCPMHPEVVSDHPGSCPKCGMALEPRTATFETGPS